MEASRGANLVGMSVWPPDVGLSPCLAKKKAGDEIQTYDAPLIHL